MRGVSRTSVLPPRSSQMASGFLSRINVVGDSTGTGAVMQPVRRATPKNAESRLIFVASVAVTRWERGISKEDGSPRRFLVQHRRTIPGRRRSLTLLQWRPARPYRRYDPCEAAEPATP